MSLNWQRNPAAKLSGRNEDSALGSGYFTSVLLHFQDALGDKGIATEISWTIDSW